MIYGYRDITEVSFLDTTTGELVTFIDYLQTASQTYGNEIVYALAGRGAPKRVGFQAKNELKLEITAGLLSPEILSLMFGTGLTTGIQNVPVTQKINATSNTFDLAATPVIGATTPMTVSYAVDGSNPSVRLTKVAATPLATEFSLTNLTVTVNSSTYASGGTFIVTYYKASTALNKRVKFQADKFTAAYKVIGTTLWKNTADQKLYPCRITIPLLQIEISGAQLASAMDGAPTAFKFGGQALVSPTSNDLIVYDNDEGEIVSI
jgi:hypothetical protein